MTPKFKPEEKESQEELWLYALQLYFESVSANLLKIDTDAFSEAAKAMRAAGFTITRNKPE